jgi:cytoskeletal protein CcmA (bactofilin family)
LFKKNSLDVSSDKVNTVIGKGTIFQGTMVGNGLIRIDGEAKGDIKNKGDVIIGESGTVAVDLKARNVTIAGHFEGSIEAEGRLELKKTSTAIGKFKVNGLLIEEGAIVSGGMEMSLKDKDNNKVLRKQEDQGENNSEAR